MYFEWGERVRRFKQPAVMGMICRFEVVLERRSVAQRRSA
jgi:hypothetical protein